jgi:hypothetical protein
MICSLMASPLHARESRFPSFSRIPEEPKMNNPKKMLAVAAFALASAIPAAAHAETQQFTILSERFDDVTTLAGWAMVNNSSSPGLTWFQGNDGIFPAHAGAPSSYIAANFLSAHNGTGWIDNWLLTPTVALYGPSMLSFFTRADSAPGLNDTMEVRFSANADSTALGDFSTLLGTIGGIADFPSTWQQFSAGLNYEGSGRFAFRYVGDAAASNYIGLDSVIITTVLNQAPT